MLKIALTLISFIGFVIVNKLIILPLGAYYQSLKLPLPAIGMMVGIIVAFVVDFAALVLTASDPIRISAAIIMILVVKHFTICVRQIKLEIVLMMSRQTESR